MLSRFTIAQDNAYQRAFPVSVLEAGAALQKMSPSSKGRLPTLEGFVQQADQPIERYDKGYFECTFQLSPTADAGTLVRATAKVTAWYRDPDAAHSGYRVLVSNGRLESDVLDRLAEVLLPQAAVGTSGKPGSPSLAGAPSGATRQPDQSALIIPRVSTNWGARAGSSLLASTAPAASPTRAPNLERAKPMNAAEEKRSQELTKYIQNLEEIQRNQSHPHDLAAVKKPKTLIFAKPSETGQPLMEADAQDEFQILGVEGTWVHVQISGASRGWIRRSQLEMPFDSPQSSNASAGIPSSPDVHFRIAREENATFRGNWRPLQGKLVRIEWVEPANPAISTTPKDKLAYAKSAILRAKNSLPSQPTPEGIVVVFDSADGGQIAAPLSSVKALAHRTISDAAFWRECSFDPPESFLESGK